MRILFVFVLILVSSAFAGNTITRIPANQGADGQFIINGPGFPYTVEISTALAVPGASHLWHATYGYGVARGIPDSRSEFAFDPNLAQYGVHAPDGWQLIALNEDQTLGLIIPEPFGESYDTLFENGVLKEGATIRVLPVTDRLQQALQNSRNHFSVIKIPPKNGYLISGSEGQGREIILGEYTLPANESVKFVAYQGGEDSFVVACRYEFSADFVCPRVIVNTLKHEGSFVQEPDPNDPNHVLSRWRMLTSEWDWTWRHNRNNRLAKLVVDISLDGQKIRRSINIPVSNPAYRMTLLRCNRGYWANHRINFNGESPYRTGSLPAIVGEQNTSETGECNIALPYKWDGSVYTSAIECAIPIPGDMNCNGVVDFSDINPFVVAMTSKSQYESNFPNCYYTNADCNQDGSVDFLDINAFVALVSAQTGQPPEMVRQRLDSRINATKPAIRSSTNTATTQRAGPVEYNPKLNSPVFRPQRPSMYPMSQPTSRPSIER